jgi:hypothetical protein
MTDETLKKPDLRVISEELDEEEAEFRALRRDLPGAKGASAAGIVAIGVSKTPGKNEFFRTHPDFRPAVSIVDLEVGMEKQFFAVTDAMVEALAGIGITVSDHLLYLTLTARGAMRIVPVRWAGADGEMNEYARTKEIGAAQGNRHLGPAVHRPRKQGLPSLSCTGRPLCGAGLARAEAGENLSLGLS